jgi:hypothetical protein
MKRIVLLAIACLFFVSCKKEDSGSLAGTTWIGGMFSDSRDHKIVFTYTDFNYTSTNLEGQYEERVSGTYTYDPPTVEIVNRSGGLLDEIVDYGTVKNGVMEIDIHVSDDIVYELKLKKQ